MSDDTRVVVCECEICGKTLEVEVSQISSDEDDCLGIVCLKCAEDNID
jgi:hypothetical protein